MSMVNQQSVKKSLPKYLFEFLVLFIAVFLGFVAENTREKVSDRQKQTMLLKNLLNDLEMDSMRLQELIEENNRKMIALDSFIKIRHLDFSNTSNLNIFYEKWRPIEMWAVVSFKPTRATLNQLQSTGMLSTVEPVLSASISTYAVFLEQNEFNSENYYNHVEETFRMIYKMTDYISIWNDPPEYPPLITDEATLMHFFNLSADLMWSIEGYVRQLTEISNQTAELITLIETEYDL